MQFCTAAATNATFLNLTINVLFACQIPRSCLQRTFPRAKRLFSQNTAIIANALDTDKLCSS